MSVTEDTNNARQVCSSRNDQGQEWMSLILGFWLFMLPSFHSAGEFVPYQRGNFWLSAGLIMCCSIAAIFRFSRWLAWGNLFLGGWLVLSGRYLFNGDSQIEIATWVAGVVMIYLNGTSLWHLRTVQQMQVRKRREA